MKYISRVSGAAGIIKIIKIQQGFTWNVENHHIRCLRIIKIQEGFTWKAEIKLSHLKKGFSP